LEQEANEVAAELLFQGSRFAEEALSFSTAIRTAIDLAPKYGASFESALRRYTEKHVLPCALIVFDKLPKKLYEGDAEDAEYRIHYTITSQPFRKNYFSALEIKGGVVRGSELLKKGKWWVIQDVIETELVVERETDQKPWHFQTELFTNGYKVFQFVLPPARGV
jgi:hypothetical protein